MVYQTLLLPFYYYLAALDLEKYHTTKQKIKRRYDREGGWLLNDFEIPPVEPHHIYASSLPKNPVDPYWIKKEENQEPRIFFDFMQNNNNN